MNLTQRLLELVNSNLQPLLEGGLEVPPDVRLITEEDINTLPGDVLDAMAGILLTAVVMPMVYGEPEADPERERMYADAFASHPNTIAMDKSVARFDAEGMKGFEMAEVGSSLSSLLSHMLVRQEPWEGLLWKPQGEDDHIRHADGTPIKVGGPDTKQRTEASLKSFDCEGNYHEFCDQISMAMNQIGDVEMISGLLPGLLVEFKEDGVLLLTVDPAL